MPLVTIEWLKGRPMETKERLAREVTQSVAREAGCHVDGVWLRFVDVEPADWAIGGDLQSHEH